MTTEEKLERLLNPKMPEDYGISISLTELAKSEVGSAFLDAFNKAFVPFDRQHIVDKIIEEENK